MTSQLDQVCKRLGIKSASYYGNRAAPADDDWRRTATAWTVCLRFAGRRLTVPFWTGSAVSDEPSAANVLNCLVSDARAGEQTFEEFCSDFGYDSDSRKAEQLYHECAKQAPRVRQFLGEDFETVANASH